MVELSIYSFSMVFPEKHFCTYNINFLDIAAIPAGITENLLVEYSCVANDVY